MVATEAVVGAAGDIRCTRRNRSALIFGRIGARPQVCQGHPPQFSNSQGWAPHAEDGSQSTQEARQTTNASFLTEVCVASILRTVSWKMVFNYFFKLLIKMMQNNKKSFLHSFTR